MQRVNVEDLADDEVPVALYHSILLVLMHHGGWAASLHALHVPLEQVNMELIELILRDVHDLMRALRSGDIEWMRRVASREAAEIHRVEQEMAIVREEDGLQ